MFAVIDIEMDVDHINNVTFIEWFPTFEEARKLIRSRGYSPFDHIVEIPT